MGNFSPPGGFQLPGSTSWKRGLVTVDVRCFLSKKKHPKWEIWMEKKTKPPRSFFVFGGVATCSYVATDQLRPMAAPGEVLNSLHTSSCLLGWWSSQMVHQPRCRRIFGLWSWKPAMYQRSRGHPTNVDFHGRKSQVCYMSSSWK